MKSLNYTLLLFLIILITNSNEIKSQVVTITSNIDDIKVRFASLDEPNEDIGQIKNKVFKYRFNAVSKNQVLLEFYGDHVETKQLKLKRKLKKSNPFSPWSYEISEEFRKINIEMNYKDSYMESKYQEIVNSQDTNVFKNYNKLYPKSKQRLLAINKIDSLELNFAVAKRNEKAIDDYISTHAGSNFLKNAQKIKNEFQAARLAFDNVKKGGSSELVFKFLQEYPNSIEYNEANALYVKRAFDEKMLVTDIDDILHFTDSILYNKRKYLQNSDFNNYKIKTCNKVDELIAAPAEKDKSYNNLKMSWDQYQNIKARYEEKLGSFSRSYALSSVIYTTLFNELTKLNSEKEQSTYLSKAKKDFKSLDKCNGSNVNEDLIGCIIFNAQKPDGTIKLYNQKALKKRFFYEGEIHHLLTYKEKPVEDLDLDYEEITFKNNKEIKFDLFKENQPVIKFKFDNCENRRNCPFYTAFYQNGSLVHERFNDGNRGEYTYDYENGINISLKNLDNKIKEADAAIAKKDFETALNILNNDCKNNYPKTIIQNEKINNSIAKADLLKEEYLKKQEEIKKAEKKKREQEKLKELEALLSELGGSSNNSQNNKNDNNRQYDCEWCGNRYVDLKGYSIYDKDNCRIEQYSFNVYGGSRFNRYCSQKCAKEACWNSR